MPAIASGGRVRTYGAVAGASSLATTITSGGTNAKGAAVELIAATEIDAHWLLVTFANASQANGYLVDILAGAATEQVIVPDIFLRPKGAGAGWGSFLGPVFIPRGTRLAARCQGGATSLTIGVAVTLFAAGPVPDGSPPPGIVSAYGALAASSLGTLVDPGGVADTDSAWVELTAATDRDHHWLILSGWYGDNALGAVTHWRTEVGIGAATEEVPIASLHASAEVTTDLPFNPVEYLPCFVPRGSRLTIRVRSSSITSGDRAVRAVLYGAG